MSYLLINLYGPITYGSTMSCYGSLFTVRLESRLRMFASLIRKWTGLRHHADYTISRSIVLYRECNISGPSHDEIIKFIIQREGN